MSSTQPNSSNPSGQRQIIIPWPDSGSWRKWGFQALLFLVLAYLAYLVRDIWVPLLLAFLLATVLDPVVDRLELRGWSRSAAASLIYAAFLLLFTVATVLAYPHLVVQIESIRAGFASNFPDTSPAGLKTRFGQLGVSPPFADFLIKVITGTTATFRSTSRISEYGVTVVTNIIWLVIIPIIAFYALRDYHLILGKGLLLVPKERRDLVQTAVAETTAIFAKYLRGMAIVSILNGIATWILLFAFHIPSALVIAIGATILYNVPYLGAIAINALIAAVSFLHGGVHEMAIVTGIGLLMHNVLFDQIISPRILGGHVGLHPILSILALLIGNLLLGIVGMILAVPVAACIQIGVLALVPKLRHEIEMPKEAGPPAAVSVNQIAAETFDTHAKADATEELHKSVNAAVDNIEEKIVQAEEADEDANLDPLP